MKNIHFDIYRTDIRVTYWQSYGSYYEHHWVLFPIGLVVSIYTTESDVSFSSTNSFDLEHNRIYFNGSLEGSTYWVELWTPTRKTFTINNTLTFRNEYSTRYYGYYAGQWLRNWFVISGNSDARPDLIRGSLGRDSRGNYMTLVWKNNTLSSLDRFTWFDQDLWIYQDNIPYHNDDDFITRYPIVKISSGSNAIYRSTQIYRNSLEEGTRYTFLSMQGNLFNCESLSSSFVNGYCTNHSLSTNGDEDLDLNPSPNGSDDSYQKVEAVTPFERDSNLQQNLERFVNPPYGITSSNGSTSTGTGQMSAIKWRPTKTTDPSIEGFLIKNNYSVPNSSGYSKSNPIVLYTNEYINGEIDLNQLIWLDDFHLMVYGKIWRIPLNYKIAIWERNATHYFSGITDIEGHWYEWSDAGLDHSINPPGNSTTNWGYGMCSQWTTSDKRGYALGHFDQGEVPVVFKGTHDFKNNFFLQERTFNRDTSTWSTSSQNIEWERLNISRTSTLTLNLRMSGSPLRVYTSKYSEYNGGYTHTYWYNAQSGPGSGLGAETITIQYFLNNIPLLPGWSNIKDKDSYPATYSKTDTNAISWNDRHVYSQNGWKIDLCYTWHSSITYFYLGIEVDPLYNIQKGLFSNYWGGVLKDENGYFCYGDDNIRIYNGSSEETVACDWNGSVGYAVNFGLLFHWKHTNTEGTKAQSLVMYPETAN